MKNLVITINRRKFDERVTWKSNEYDNYYYYGDEFFAVEKNGEWVGLYRLDRLVSVEVKEVPNEDSNAEC